MLEPPALAEEAIAGALEAGFGVRVAGLVFLPVGNDAASWAYRVEVARGPSLLDAATGAEVGLSPAQWRQLGAAVRRAHSLPPTPDLAGRGPGEEDRSGRA